MECGASFGEMLDLVHNVSLFKGDLSLGLKRQSQELYSKK